LKIRVASVAFLTILCLALSAPALADIFNNGPTNGQLNGFFIDGPGGPFGQTISDGFVAFNGGNAFTLDFAEWVPTGTTPTSVSWMLGTSSFGSQISSGSMGQVGYTFFGTSGFGYDVYISHVTGLSGALTAGQTYYLTLGGANDSSGSQFDAWDVNEGVGAEGGIPATCSFAVGGVPQGDCPSTESESFTISGGTTGTTPEPSSIMLFGSGVLGLAGVLRRKLTR
jgi:hypothetical protein